MAVGSDISFRPPVREDGASLYQLITECPPLDVNSSYLYFIVADHFASTSVVAEVNGKLVGCITGYQRPGKPDTLFVWQVAVHESMRGKGLSGQMLNQITGRKPLSELVWIETTISPSNIPSRKLFERWAKDRGVAITSGPYLAAGDFPLSSASHEAEDLFCIGPLSLT